MIWCFTKKLCMRCDAWVGTLLWWSCQSPDAHSCSLLNHPNSFCGGMFKLITKFDSDSLLYWLILNAMATQYTCSLKGIYHPHWLVRWSRHCSYMCIPVHSPWLPVYINVMQTIPVILTMAGLFPDIPLILKKFVDMELSLHLSEALLSSQKLSW